MQAHTSGSSHGNAAQTHASKQFWAARAQQFEKAGKGKEFLALHPPTGGGRLDAAAGANHGKKFGAVHSARSGMDSNLIAARNASGSDSRRKPVPAPAATGGPKSQPQPLQPPQPSVEKLDPQQHDCSCGPRSQGFCEVELLPALPADWDSGKAAGLASRCGVAVDIEWSQGRVTRATLRPLRHAPSSKVAPEIRIRVPRGGRLSVSSAPADSAPGGGKQGGMLGWLGLSGSKTEAAPPPVVDVSHQDPDETVTIIRLPEGLSRPIVLLPV